MILEQFKERCRWSISNPLMMEYHDSEWGVPQHDDRMLFELLILEGAQAGLSWQTVLNRRMTYRQAFDGFDIEKIACYTDVDRVRLLADPGIIRNRLKVDATIINAQKFLEVQREFGSFDAYIWKFVHNKPLNNKLTGHDQVPARNAISDAMSKDLTKRGFKFVGSTICYAYMQAIGMVNDHVQECFRATVTD